MRKAFFHILIGIYGSYAAAGGAVGLACGLGESVFLHYVLQNVVGHCYDGLVAYFEVFGSDFDARVPQIFDFAAEMFDVDYHAAAENVDNVVAQNARRKQVEYELALFVDYGVTAALLPTLIAAYDVEIARKQVNHSALAFIAPVDTTDTCQHNKGYPLEKYIRPSSLKGAPRLAAFVLILTD